MDDEHFRREEDRKWLKFQEQLMNLVTTQRTSQQDLAKLETEVTQLAEHVEEVDDHLRGVAGKESMETRVTVMEKEVFQHGVLFPAFAKHVGALEKDLETIKIHRGIAEKLDVGKLERFKEWLRFWGPIIIASMVWIGPMARVVMRYWSKPVNIEYRMDERLRKEIEADKRSTRKKAVDKKLADIERTRKALEENAGN